AVHEALAEIPDRPLHLALGPGSIRPAGAYSKAPVRREAKELGILDQLSALVAQIPGDDARHLVEEDFARYAAEEGEGLLQTREQGPHVLLRIEAEPQKSRIAEHQEERVALAPGEGELGKIDLSLCSWLRLEPDDRIGQRFRANLLDEDLELRQPARVSGGADLVEEPNGREL